MLFLIDDKSGRKKRSVQRKLTRIFVRIQKGAERLTNAVLSAFLRGLKKIIRQGGNFKQEANKLVSDAILDINQRVNGKQDEDGLVVMLE